MPLVSPKLVLVAQDYSFLPGCSFSAPCVGENNGIVSKRMNFISKLLFYNIASNITVKFVAAIEYGKDPANPSENSTITGLLYNGKADISVMMAFTEKRAKHLKNLGPLLESRINFAFLKGRPIKAELNIFEFISWKPYSLTFGLIFEPPARRGGLSVHTCLFVRCCNSSSCNSPDNFTGRGLNRLS